MRKIFWALALVAMLMSVTWSAILADHVYDTPDTFNDLEFQPEWLSNEYGWGPVYEPAANVTQESYVEANNGYRTVQYFDKTRMEDRSFDPLATWQVTNGLLVTELVTGQMQFGDHEFTSCNPSNVHVSGDPGQTDPLTYADFADEFEPFTYEWAPYFADFMSQPGSYKQVGEVMSPVKEKVVPVDGVMKTVFVQLGERQALTYTPENAPEHRLQYGNVGQHYFEWRYGGASDCDNDGGSTPPPPVDDNVKKGRGMSLDNCAEHQVAGFVLCTKAIFGTVSVSDNVLTFDMRPGPAGETSIAMSISGNGAVHISTGPNTGIWLQDAAGNITLCGDACRTDMNGDAILFVDGEVSIYIGAVYTYNNTKMVFTVAPSADGFKGRQLPY